MSLIQVYYFIQIRMFHTFLLFGDLVERKHYIRCMLLAQPFAIDVVVGVIFLYEH